MSTLAAPLSEEDFNDPNQVKVVLDAGGYAIYFLELRFRIEETRTKKMGRWGHLCLEAPGMYGYEASFLESFSTWKPGVLGESNDLSNWGQEWLPNRRIDRG